MRKRLRNRIFLGILAGILFLCTEDFSVKVQAAERMQPTEEKVVIVIDPGHGGPQEGTTENGFLEKSMTLTTALAAYEELQKYDNAEVYLTRTDDRELTLKERAEFAHAVNADFLFSFHYNASLSHLSYGSEVWIPLNAPFNAYGYQFGTVLMNAMDDMGLFLRGIKTREGDNGDYYGIIREAVALDIPAAIIEHCYVDEERDTVFCDTKEKQEALGKADATAIAKYFGLYSESLGADYRSYHELPETDPQKTVKSTLIDETAPDVCMIEWYETDYESGQAKLTVSATDYDSALLYYDYSIDGGESYSPLYPWPETDVLTGDYKDTFHLAIEVPDGTFPQIIVRAYNLWEFYTESNALYSKRAFYKAEENLSANPDTNEAETESQSEQETTDSGTIKEETLPVLSEDIAEAKEPSLLTFLNICLICVVVILGAVIISQGISYHRRKKMRRQRRKDSGDRNSHIR